MESRGQSLLLIAGLSLLASACIPSDAPVPGGADGADGPGAANGQRQLTMTPQELVDEWKRITGNATDVVATFQHHRVIQALADTSSTVSHFVYQSMPSAISPHHPDGSSRERWYATA